MFSRPLAGLAQDAEAPRKTDGWTVAQSTHESSDFLRAPNKMIVAPRASVFASGKEGEAGHPRMVDGA